jgi:hypothetical protein
VALGGDVGCRNRGRSATGLISHCAGSNRLRASHKAALAASAQSVAIGWSGLIGPRSDRGRDRQRQRGFDRATNRA